MNINLSLQEFFDIIAQEELNKKEIGKRGLIV